MVSIHHVTLWSTLCVSTKTQRFELHLISTAIGADSSGHKHHEIEYATMHGWPHGFCIDIPAMHAQLAHGASFSHTWLSEVSSPPKTYKYCFIMAAWCDVLSAGLQPHCILCKVLANCTAWSPLLTRTGMGTGTGKGRDNRLMR